MKILREQDERQSHGEYDFWLSTKEHAAAAQRALSENGFLVGGSAGELRATVATDSVSHRTDVDEARGIIAAVPKPGDAE